MTKKLVVKLTKQERSILRRKNWGTFGKYQVDDVLRYKHRMSTKLYDCALKWAHGKSQETVAAELQIPHGTVKSRTWRAFKLLDSLMAQDAEIS